jgi:glycosyltransferase involved in cell wall biosynthesis
MDIRLGRLCATKEPTVCSIPAMRILVLNWRDITHPSAGGAEVYIHELAKRWAAWGHDVTLLCGGYQGCKMEETIHGLKIIRHGGKLTVYARAFFEYVRRFRNNCDVIVDVENGIPFFAPFYARKPTVVLVHHVHKEQFFVEEGFPLNWIGYILETKVMSVAYRRALCIAVSQSTKGDLIQLGIPPHRIMVVHNGIDHGLYRQSTIKSPTPTILYLGRLKQYKRLDLLLHTMPQVLQVHPDALLWIAGHGDAREKLEHLVIQLGLCQHVRFWGFVDEDIKVQLLQRAWVLVNPSMGEGWGLSVLEANACGTPAVVFDVPGLRDAVLDGRTGFVVPDGEVGSLSRRIELILGDLLLRKQLQQSAITWSQHFTWDNSARSMLAMLERVREGEKQMMGSRGADQMQTRDPRDD